MTPEDGPLWYPMIKFENSVQLEPEFVEKNDFIVAKLGSAKPFPNKLRFVDENHIYKVNKLHR